MGLPPRQEALKTTDQTCVGTNEAKYDISRCKSHVLPVTAKKDTAL